MQKTLKVWRTPVIVALMMHALLILFFLVKMPAEQYRLKQQASSTHAPKKVIQVAAVSARDVQATVKAIERQRAQEKARKLAHEKRIRAQAIAAHRAEQQAALRVAQLKKQQRLLAEKIQKERKERRLRAIKAAKHAAKQKAIKAAKARQALLAKKRREKKLAQLKVQQQALQQKLAQEQMAQDQKRLSQLQARAQQGVINQYKAKILSVIQSNWRIPSVNDQLNCVYQVNLAPGGVVLSVHLDKSSGNSALDQSAKVAIYKSSPLPVPKDPAVFDAFRHLVLTLTPAGYLKS